MALAPHHRKRLIFLLKLAVSVVTIALLVHLIDVDQVTALVRRARLELLALSAAALIGQTAISAFKWRLLLRAQGADVGYPALLQAYLIGDFVNLFAPGVVGGDAYRAAWLRQHTGTLGTALPSIIVDRLTGLSALLLVASLGLGAIFLPRYAWAVGAAVLIALVVGYLLAIGPVDRWLGRRPGGRLGGVVAMARLAIGQIKPSRTLVAVGLLSLVFQFNTVAILWLYAQAMRLSIDFSQLLLAVPTVSVLEMVPISVNGIGLREGAFSLLLGQMGVPAAQGFVLGLTVSVMRYVAGLVGGGLLLWRMASRRD